MKRLALEARTMGVSLRCALEDLQRQEGLTPAERSQLELGWRDRASTALLDIEARRLRLVTRVERGIAGGVDADRWVDAMAACVHAISAARLVTEIPASPARTEPRTDADRSHLDRLD